MKNFLRPAIPLISLPAADNKPKGGNIHTVCKVFRLHGGYADVIDTSSRWIAKRLPGETLHEATAGEVIVQREGSRTGC